MLKRFVTSFLGATLLFLTSAPTNAEVSHAALLGDLNLEIKKELIEEYPYLKAEDIKVEYLNLDELRFKIPKASQRYTFAINEEKELLGKSIARINFYSKDDFLSRYTMLIKVDAMAPFFTSVNTLTEGDIIQEGDLEESKALLYGSNRRAIHDVNRLVGKTVKFTIHAGQMINNWMVEDPPLVQRGDIVNTVYKNKTIEVSVKAKALADGKKGDKIALRLLHNNELEHGVVETKDEVAIYTRY